MTNLKSIIVLQDDAPTFEALSKFGLVSRFVEVLVPELPDDPQLMVEVVGDDAQLSKAKAEFDLDGFYPSRDFDPLIAQPITF